jgi:hypothetical protein
MGAHTLKDTTLGLINVTQTHCKYADPSIVTLLSTFLSILPFILGVPGNIIIIIIANRKHNRDLSPCIYMMAMAVVDAILLTISMGIWPLYFGTDLIQHFREEIFL